MTETFIITRNYSRISEAIARLKALPSTAPKMGLGYGSFGLGKTFALERLTAENNAVLLRGLQVWTKQSFLEELCLELGLDSTGRSPKLYKRVIDELLQSPRIIIIDEIDAILRTQKTDVLELIRDIHDQTYSVIFIIGMEEANGKLKRNRHFYSRIVEFANFRPIGIDDIKRFCAATSDKVKIEADLCEFFAQQYPNLRQIRVLLIRLEAYALRNKLSACGLKTFKQSKVEEEGKQ